MGESTQRVLVAVYKKRRSGRPRGPRVVLTQEEGGAAGVGDVPRRVPACVRGRVAPPAPARVHEGAAQSGLEGGVGEAVASNGPEMMPPPPPSLRPRPPRVTCERVKHELFALIDRVLQARAPTARAGILEGIRRNHWDRVPQALRVIEEKYGPAPGRPPRPFIDHTRRLERFLEEDCGAERLAQVGLTPARCRRRYLHGTPFPTHPEQHFLRLEKLFGVEQRVAPEAFVLAPRAVLERVYTAAGQFDKILGIDVLLAQVGDHTAQLLRAVVEKHLPAHLPPGAPRAARLRAFSVAHRVPIGGIFPPPDDATFEAGMLSLVVEHGAEPLDVWRFEMADVHEGGLHDSPTPMV